MLVIFDCDGVLVDSEPLAIRANREYFTRYGWEITEAESVALFTGVSLGRMKELVEAKLGHPIPEDWHVDFSRIMTALFDAELQAVPGVSELLATLECSRCVASSGSHEKIEHSLRLTHLYDYFEGRIFSASDVERGKPAPDLFLFAASSLGFDPGDCVVIEDSVPGVRAGLAAGMKVLAYSGSVTSARTLRATGATVFDVMEDVPQLLFS